MKKTLFTLSLIAISFMGFSQAAVSIGLKAGANFSNASSAFAGQDFDNESITSFHGGAYSLIKLANIGIQPELLFSKQGSSVDGDDIDLSYVNVPVLLKFYFPGGLTLHAGPQFGILTDAVDEDGDDLKDTFKNSDLGAAVGAGWDAPLGLQFGARYVFSLSDNSDVDGFEYKNKTFQLYIGYSLFKLGN